MEKKGWKRYHTIWMMLFLGWFVSYLDRTATGPVVTWMIDNKISFLAQVPNPHEFGGLLGSLFFAGFMLNQFPGGYLGDKFGYRAIIILSITWAALATILTGIIGGLVMFVALRVILGLGEGVFYSNDRSYIAFNTPPEKMGLGMGVVITGLSVGLTVATLGVPILIKAAEPMMGKEAWRSPFLVLGVFTCFVVILLFKYMKPKSEFVNSVDPESPGVKENYGKALLHLSMYSVVFLGIIMTIYFSATTLGLSGVAIAFILTGLVPLLILYLYKTKKSDVRPVLMNRNLVFLYISAIPILWHLWFYGFWSVSIIKDFGGGALVAAALIASFNGLAGIIGFPLGGMLSDKISHRPNGRRNVLALLTGLLTISLFTFTVYVMTGNHNPVVMSIILFVSGLFFFALQPVAHALTAELAPGENRGTAFGMWNLIAEVGAVLSPVVSGFLRDSTGKWGASLILDTALMAISCLLVIAITSNARRISSKEESSGVNRYQ